MEQGSQPVEAFELLHAGHLVAGRYQIERHLGRGGMGTVYLAKDRVLDGEYVAIKILHPEFSHDEKQTQRFLREVQLMRRINHPNVVRTFEVGADADLIYFTMEYIEGEGLDASIKEDRFPFEQAPSLIAQVCRALETIHQANIIHRDLKPANIIVQKNGVVKLTDFGIARPDQSNLTGHNEIIGSAAYMAPEIWLGKPPTPSIDFYSLGVVLYELTTKTLPFEADSPGALMRLHLDRPPTPPKELNKSVPPWLNRLTLKLLAKSIQDRPRNAAEVIDYVVTHTQAIGGLTGESNEGVTPSVTGNFIAQLEQMSKSSTQSNESLKNFSRKDKPSGRSQVITNGRSIRASGANRKSKVYNVANDSWGSRLIGSLVCLGFTALTVTFGLYLFAQVFSAIASPELAGLATLLDGAAVDLATQQLRPQQPRPQQLQFREVLPALAVFHLLFIYSLSMPVALIFSLSGSGRTAWLAFSFVFGYLLLVSLLLLVQLLFPLLSHFNLDALSLLQSEAALVRQFCDLALLNPVFANYEQVVSVRGLSYANPLLSTVITNPLGGVLFFGFIGLMLYLLQVLCAREEEKAAALATGLIMFIAVIVEVSFCQFSLTEFGTFNLGFGKFNLSLRGYCAAAVVANFAILAGAVLWLRLRKR